MARHRYLIDMLLSHYAVDARLPLWKLLYNMKPWANSTFDRMPVSLVFRQTMTSTVDFPLKMEEEHNKKLFLSTCSNKLILDQSQTRSLAFNWLHILQTTSCSTCREQQFVCALLLSRFLDYYSPWCSINQEKMERCVLLICRPLWLKALNGSANEFWISVLKPPKWKQLFSPKTDPMLGW